MRKMAEIPILAHADLIIVDKANIAAELKKVIAGAEFRLFASDGGTAAGNILEGAVKMARPAAPSVDAVLLMCGKTWPGSDFDLENEAILSRMPNVRFRKVPGKDFIECFNKAVKTSTAEYIFFLGSSTLLNERTLPDLLFCPGVSADFGIICPASNLSTGVNVGKKQLEAFIPKHYKANLGHWESRKAVYGECFLLRKEMARMIGGLDRRFLTYPMALFDYCIKAFQAGCEVIGVNESFVLYSEPFIGEVADVKTDDKLILSKWGYGGTEFLEKLS
jgi:hypothetical protein